MITRRLLLTALLAASGCGESADSSRADAAQASADATPPGSPDVAPNPDAAPTECTPPSPTEGDSITAFRVPPLTIAIDGEISEQAWSFARRVEFANPARSDNQVRVYALWDDQSLYFAYEVADSQLDATGVELFRDDGAEIYLDTAHDATPALNEDDFHFIVNIEDETSGGIIVVNTDTGGGGYVTEIAVPWQTLDLSPAPNTTYGLLLGNNDRDLDESAQFDWLGLIESGPYGRPNLWGALVLSPQACSD